MVRPRRPAVAASVARLPPTATKHGQCIPPPPHPRALRKGDLAFQMYTLIAVLFAVFLDRAKITRPFRRCFATFRFAVSGLAWCALCVQVPSYSCSRHHLLRVQFTFFSGRCVANFRLLINIYNKKLASESLVPLEPEMRTDVHWGCELFLALCLDQDTRCDVCVAIVAEQRCSSEIRVILHRREQNHYGENNLSII